jgi:hypothetical protein
MVESELTLSSHNAKDLIGTWRLGGMVGSLTVMVRMPKAC